MAEPPIKPEPPAVLAPIQSPLSWPACQVACYDTLVAGAGLAGATLARLLADRAGQAVLVVDPRPALANVLSSNGALRPADGRSGMVQRRRGAAFLAQFSRCDRCQESDVPCIHSAEPDELVIERLLDHPAIDLLLGATPDQARETYRHERFVAADFAGPSNSETVALAMAAFDRVVAASEGERPIASAA